MDVARFYEAHTHINMYVLNMVSNFQMNQNKTLVHLCVISPSLSPAK